MFDAVGYGATNLRKVADRADVAIQTIHFVFGNKRRLLKELADVPIAIVERPWFREALAARIAVAGVGQVLQRVAVVNDMVATPAASDAEIAQLWPDGDKPRLRVHATAAEAATTKPGARPGVTLETAVDTLFGLLSRPSGGSGGRTTRCGPSCAHDR
ncbi:helix-turn-helix domain-containing protein [Actinoplanes sp. NPDC024001]|uniref:TetR/AcrR family transcriptional regulator n=1 Tax=Actinoplanes sp. NPDC024001 TaxID=3154598 RepID=UPI0033D983C0